MKLDTEQQRQILLQLIDQATFPGSAIEVVMSLKQAVRAAALETDDPQEERA